MIKTKLETIRNRSQMMILFLMVGVLFASLLTSILVERKNTKTITSYIMQVLSKYTLGISDEISTCVKTVATQSSSVQNMMKAASKEQIRDELYRITAANNNVIRNMALVSKSPDGSYMCISSISTHDAALLQHYQKLMNHAFELLPTDSYPILLTPYEEKMGLSVILPFMVNSRKTRSFMLFEVNATLMLTNMKNVRRTSLLNHEISVLINLYDSSGILLETSANIRKKTTATLQKDGIFPRFDFYDNNLELFTFATKGKIWMMQRDSDIGLSVAVCIPAGVIDKNTTNTRFAILSIALLSSIAILLTLLTTVRVAKTNQRWAVMQAETRFNALQNMMRPHLLFNTLDSMVCAIEEKDDTSALACIKALAYILRIDLRNNEAEIPITTQIKYLRSYIDLQKIRYKDKFDFKMDIDLGNYSLDSFKILKLCIQPLVENCFVHSVYEGKPFTRIAVTYAVTDKLIITVFNDSVTLTEQEREKLRQAIKTKKELETSHIGLMSISERIRLRYGKEYGLDILPASEGFSVRVRLPVLIE